MNGKHGKNGGPSATIHDVLYQQIKSRSDEAVKAALSLADETDQAAQKIVTECETLCQAVKEGTEQIRSELRERMVEFATVMNDYSEAIAAKNTAYVEATRKTIEMISSHVKTVRATIKIVAPERAAMDEHDAELNRTATPNDRRRPSRPFPGLNEHI